MKLGNRDEAERKRRAAHQILMERRAISDTAMRSSYLENIAIHREIAAY